MTVQEIAQLLGQNKKFTRNDIVRYLSTDSRAISFPEETLFIALKTQRDNGHNYIEGAYNLGVRNFLVSEIQQFMVDVSDANFIQVPDTLKALQLIAREKRNLYRIPIIGITGSNGKTIVKEWLYQLLSPDFKITRSPRSYNSQIGVPISLWMLDEESQLGIFEAGISEMGEMQALEEMIRPNIGVFTNIGEAHQVNFKTIHDKVDEKLQLFKHCYKVIYCQQSYAALSIKKKFDNAICCPWSTKPSKKKKSLVTIQHKQVEENSTQITYTKEGCSEYYTFSIPFTDDASFENACHCLTYMVSEGYEHNVIAERMALLEPVAMRLEVKDGKNNCLVINDYYNSDANSLSIAIDFMASRALSTHKRRTVIISDIQPGRSMSKFYMLVSRLLRTKQIDRLIGIGPDISKYQSQFKLESLFFNSTEEFLHSPEFAALSNEVILLKGARSFQFERIFEQLSEKVHQTTLEVNLNSLVDNFNFYRSKLDPTTKIIVMVKAFAYGAGSYEIAKSLQDARCDYIAVAVVDEGVELRNAGITMPIIVMNPELNSLKQLFEYQLQPEVYSIRLLNAIIAEASCLGISNYPVHVKLDTGMHRLGFTEGELPELISTLKEQQNLQVRSIFSHLAGSDASEFDQFTTLQYTRFKQMSSQIQAAFKHKILCHILNSAGIERFIHYQMDMVRLGIGLYGVGVTPQFSAVLRPVSKLCTTILQIKQLEAGETVGYSRREELKRPSRVAAIPIGYADGLNRRMGNRVASVYVNGYLAPIIGSICMDVSMIDVTDIPVKEGDKVEIFGDNISINTIAELIGTIPYEVITSVSSRVKRVYVHD